MTGAMDNDSCRWAAAMKDSEGIAEFKLVDLSPQEQVSRGQELLSLLLDTSSDRSRLAPPQPVSGNLAIDDDSDVQLTVKRTFLELVPSPSRCRRTRSEPPTYDVDAEVPVLPSEDSFTTTFMSPSSSGTHPWHKEARADSSTASTGEPFDFADELPFYDNSMDGFSMPWSAQVHFSPQCTTTWWGDQSNGEVPQWQLPCSGTVVGDQAAAWQWVYPVDNSAQTYQREFQVEGFDMHVYD